MPARAASALVLLAAVLLAAALPLRALPALQAPTAAPAAGDVAGAGAATPLRLVSVIDGVLVGLVRDQDSGAPIADVDIEVVGGVGRARSGPDGRFTLRGLSPGRHVLRFRRVGYRPGDALAEVANATRATERALDAGAPLEPELVVELERVPTPLGRVVVSPGHYGVLRQEPTAVQTLSREALAVAPQVGEDLFRIVGRLPGVAASDFSAAFRVRGGANDEMLVLLDGLPLYEPFHLKDFDGALSIVDVAAIGGVDLATGGFGAQYGDRLTGVLDMRTVTPEAGEMRTELALTVTSLRGTSQGRFADGRGSWLVSARQGFLQYALALAGEQRDADPEYNDALAKLTYQLTPAHGVSLHLLRARDRLSYRADVAEPRLNSAYGSDYLWGVWNASWQDWLTSRTVVSMGWLSWDRAGDRISAYDHEADLEVTDARDFTAAGLRQEWNATLSERAHLSAGFELRRTRADYRYARAQRLFTAARGRLLVRRDSLAAALAPYGNAGSAFVLQRLRPWDALTAEVGVRVDRQTRQNAPAGRTQAFLAQQQVSPRVGIAWSPGGRTTVRGAWGHYWQAQGVHELAVSDRDATFAPAERAEQRTLGVEHAFAGGISARLELYDRRVANVRPRWVGVDGALELFPEVGPDRQLLAPGESRARGAELLLRRSAPTGVSWTASYARSSARDRLASGWIPRPLDQRDALTLDVAWRPSPQWSVGMAWLYHSGWPTTAFQITVDTLRDGAVLVRHIYDERNADRLPAYHRLDARVSRRFDLGGGRLSMFVDVFNVYDRRNPRAAQSNGEQYAVSAREGSAFYFDTLLPRVPSVGVSWQF